MRIFLGLLMIVGGALLTLKANWIVANFGYSEFAESKIKMYGGSRLLWKLIGIITIFIGFLVVTNLYGDLIMMFFGSTLGGLKRTPGY
ncbi:MAG: hypothetical protein AB1352_01945 [Patescibacteria group bacterium]